jgi:hypothetical protein
MLKLVLAALAVFPAGSVFAQGGSLVHEAAIAGDGALSITAEIWVDNWFQLYANGAPVFQDSVPYATERSFNAERVTLTADLPLTIAIEFRDFMQNDTGLEYIGTDRQKIGDGGAIAQFRNSATGAVVAVTNANWRCQVVQQAPMSDDCAAAANPEVGVGACASNTFAVSPDWTAPEFDDQTWEAATEHSARSVDPKGGYDAISWDRSARLIWSADLFHDNIVLCRTRIIK